VDSEVELWLEGLESRRALGVFQRFLDEAIAGHRMLGGMTPGRLLDFQGKAQDRERFVIPEVASRWIDGMPLTEASKNTYFSCVRSFFLRRNAPFPPYRPRWTNSVAPVEPYLPIEDLRLIANNSNKEYKAIFLLKFQTLTDNRGLIHISDTHAERIVKAISQNQGIIRLSMPPRKSNPNPYFTMLDTGKSDAAEALRIYFKSTTNDIFTHLFWNQGGNPLTDNNLQYYFHRRAVETGVISQITPKCSRCGAKTIRRRLKYPDATEQEDDRKVCYECPKCPNIMWACELGSKWRRQSKRHRYTARLHETRDLGSSRWGQSGADRFVREVIMGHNMTKLDPNKYEKVKYQEGLAEDEYRKALPYLNILSVDPDKISRSQVDAEREGTKHELELMRNEVGRMRRIFDNPLMVRFLEEKLAELQREQE